MSPESIVRTYRREQTGFVLLNQPERRNALSLEMRALLRGYIEEMQADHGVRAIVLAGIGKTFCAGGDLKTLKSETTASMLERQYDVQGLLRAIMSGDKPVIAAVEGMALGAGLSIALACDIVVASREAQFGSVFGKVGLAPDLGLTWTLQRRVSMGRARLMVLTGRLIAAEQGAQWGLVDELVEAGEALNAAGMIASEIATNAPLPTRFARRALAQPFSGPDQAMDVEALAQTLFIGTEDFSEGFSAFAEKRPPRFGGK